MVSEEYLPAILVLGYTLRKYKNKYNVVCMVQDKPTHKIINGEKKYFPGVSKNSIDEILKIYDVVYGVDLIKTITQKSDKYHFTEQLKHYKNISVYTTKSQVFGLLDYKRVLFLDASLVVHKNIDYLFTEYTGNTFLNEISLDKAAEITINHTNQYAKRQETWFKHQFNYDCEIIDFNEDIDKYCSNILSLYNKLY